MTLKELEQKLKEMLPEERAQFLREVNATSASKAAFLKQLIGERIPVQWSEQTTK